MNEGNLRICVERPLSGEEHIHSQLHSSSHTDDHYQRLQAAFQTQKLWPVGTKEITIQFVSPATHSVAGQTYFNPPTPKWTPIRAFGDRPLDPLEKELRGNTDFKEVVKRVYMERYQPIIPFKLRFVEQGGDVRISFVGDAGSWSLVGTDCLKSPQNEATLNYGWLDVPTIMHEFGHVLGMIHEHQNPRGNTIQWDEPAVYSWAARTQGWDRMTTYNNILMKYDKNQINGSEFDPNSIMLYFFPASLTTNNEGTHENARLSLTDVIWIEKMYAGGEESPTKFYRNVYGGNGILSVFDGNGGDKNHILIVIIIAILIIILLLIIFKKRD